MDALSVHDHAQVQFPEFELKPALKAADLRLDHRPIALRGDQSFDPGPLTKGHLDGVKAAPAREQFEQILAEKRRIHAELKGQRPSQACAQLLDQLAQERLGPLVVLHVAGPVLKPQNLSGLCPVRQQGIVTESLGMMRIVAVHRPGDLVPGADHGAVHVNAHAPQVHRAHLVVQKFAIDPHQGTQRVLRELLEPVDYRAIAGDARQIAQSRKQRIRTDVAQMCKPAPPDQQQTNYHQHQTHTAVIAPKLVGSKSLADAPVQSDQPKIAPHQLQTTIGSKTFACEFQRPVPFDHLPQPLYHQPHLWGLPCRLELRGQRILNYARKALFVQPLSLFLQNYFRIRVRRGRGRGCPPGPLTRLSLSVRNNWRRVQVSVGIESQSLSGLRYFAGGKPTARVLSNS